MGAPLKSTLAIAGHATTTTASRFHQSLDAAPRAVVAVPLVNVGDPAPAVVQERPR